jgi:23S rRNA pseudouridine955/2504/2580 synthase
MANRINTVKVNHDDEGIRLDRWFKRHFKHVPFGMIAKLLRKGLIKLNGKKCDVSQKIQTGDEIMFPEFTIDPDVKIAKRNDKLEKEIVDSILYKDENIIVLNKPVNFAVQGGSKIAYSIDDLSHCLQFGYEDKPKLVHRLDKETSGILILARKANIAAELARIFKHKELKKYYLAILQGVPKPHEGKIDIPIEKFEKDKFEKVRKTHNKSKRAVTFYKSTQFTN